MDATDVEVVQLHEGSFAEIGVRDFGNATSAEIDHARYYRSLLETFDHV